MTDADYWFNWTKTVQLTISQSTGYLIIFARLRHASKTGDRTNDYTEQPLICPLNQNNCQCMGSCLTNKYSEGQPGQRSVIQVRDVSITNLFPHILICIYSPSHPHKVSSHATVTSASCSCFTMSSGLDSRSDTTSANHAVCPYFSQDVKTVLFSLFLSPNVFFSGNVNGRKLTNFCFCLKLFFNLWSKS